MCGGPDKVEETSAEKTATSVAAEQWNRYQQTFKPFELTWIKDVTSPNAATLTAKQGRIAGQATADVAQKAAVLGKVNPNSGSSVDPRVYSALATTQGNAVINAKTAVKDQQLASMQKAIDLGRGQANDAQLSADNLASTASQKAILDAQTDWQETAAIGNAVGSFIGGSALIGANALNKPQAGVLNPQGNMVQQSSANSTNALSFPQFGSGVYNGPLKP